MDSTEKRMTTRRGLTWRAGGPADWQIDGRIRQSWKKATISRGRWCNEQPSASNVSDYIITSVSIRSARPPYPHQVEQTHVISCDDNDDSGRAKCTSQVEGKRRCTSRTIPNGPQKPISTRHGITHKLPRRHLPHRCASCQRHRNFE